MSPPEIGSEALKDEMLSVPMAEVYVPAIKRAARRDNRTVAAYVRSLVMRDLVSKGLITQEGEVVS